MKPEGADRNGRRTGHAGYVPRLEVLEDRSLLSVVPTLTLGADTTWLPVAGISSGTAGSGSTPTASTDNAASLNITINYSQAGIQLQYTIAGNLSVVIAGTLTSQNVTNTFDASDPQAVSYRFALSLFAGQAGPASATNFQVTILTTQTSDAASVSFTVSSTDAISGKDASGAPTADSTTIIQLQSQNLTRLAMGNSGIMMPTHAQINDPAIQSFGAVAIQSSNGTPNFSITLFRPVATDATVTSSGSYVAQNSVGRAVLISLPDGNDFGSLSKIVFGNFSPPDKSLLPDRRPISNHNSLVWTDTGAGLHLTLSITQEISQRSSSSAAQATWTGLRPPLEALLARPETPTTTVEVSLSGEETTVRVVTAVRDQDETNSRPMEIMVANILTALQQAKVENRAEDTAQAAVRESAPLDLETELAESRSEPFWPWEQRGEPDLAGNIVLPLNELLDGIALKDSETSLRASVLDAVGVPEKTAENAKGPLPSRTKVASGWERWPLAETLIAVFSALGWPGVVRIRQLTSGKFEQRLKKDALS
jgi:hypothetical protein